MDFDPQFNTPTPNYLGWSKSAHQPEADKSAGIALDTVGKGIEGAVSLTDQTIKNVIKREITDDVDQKRDVFINQLNQRLGGRVAPPGNPMDANASASDQDLMPEGQNVPSSVQRGQDELDRIQNAREQAGKFRTTGLDAAFVQSMKKFRADNPGYRDYVDEQYSSKVGYNPANKLVQDKIAQLNELTTNAQREQQYWEKKLTESGFPKSDDVLNKFRQDHDIPYVQNYLSKNNQIIQDINIRKSMFELSSQKTANDKSTAEEAINTVSTKALQAYYMNHRDVQEDGSLGPTGAEIADKLHQLSTTGANRDPEAIRQLAIQFEGLRQRAYEESRQQLIPLRNKDGSSIVGLVGAPRFKEMLDANIGTIFGVQQQMLSNEEYGLLHATQKATADVLDKKTLQVIQSPNVGGIAQTGAVLNKLMPNMSDAFKQDINGAYTSSRGGGATGVVKDILSLVKEQKRQAIAQTGGTVDSPNGPVYTFRQAQDELKRASQISGRTGPAADADFAAGMKELIKLRQGLVEPDTKIRDNAITFFYYPENRVTLSNLMDNYYDKSKGVVVQGRQSAFDLLTGKDVTEKIWERANNGNPDAWGWYKNWAKLEAGSALTTMAKTWSVNERMAETQQTIRGAEGDIPAKTDHHFTYNNETHQIGMTDLKGNLIDVESAWRNIPDAMMVKNANTMLKNLSRIAEQEGSDVNAFVFRTLKEAGLGDNDPEMYKRLMKSFITSQTPPKKKESK